MVFHKVNQSKQSSFNNENKVRKSHGHCPSQQGLSLVQNVVVGLTSKFTYVILEFAVAKHLHQHRDSRGALLGFPFIPVCCF